MNHCWASVLLGVGVSAIGICAGAGSGSAERSGGEPAGSNTVCRVILDLTDGSRVVGTTRITTLPLRTEFADLDVPLRVVQAVKWGKDRETAVLSMVNGDRLQGRLALAPLAVETCFGDVSLPVALLAGLTVTAGGDGAAGAGLVLHYTFDEDTGGRVADTSGCDNHGQAVGNVTYARSFSGKAIRIGGPRSYVVCDSKELNMDGWTEFAACAWIMFTGRRTPYGPVISRGEVTGPRTGGGGFGTGGPYGGPWNPGGGSVTLEPPIGVVIPRTFAKGVEPQPALNRWYHVALSYDGRTVCMYVDGELEASTEIAPPFQKIKDWSDTKLVIGSSPSTPCIDWGDMFFDGLIDEVRIYRGGLSAAEVRRLYQASDSAGGTGP